MKHAAIRRRISRPSPALVVAIIALVVACSGTAVAARTIITSSSQVKNGVLTGADLRNGSVANADVAKESLSGSRLRDETITLSKIRPSTRRALTSGTGSVKGSSGDGTGTVGFEAFRDDGPTVKEPGSARVATLRALPPGTYAIFAQTTLVTPSDTQGLWELTNSETANGLCELDAAGDVTKGRTILGTIGQDSGGTVNLQITRTLGRPGDIALSCASNFPWRAGSTSIIALRLGSSSRTEVAG